MLKIACLSKSYISLLRKSKHLQ